MTNSVINRYKTNSREDVLPGCFKYHSIYLSDRVSFLSIQIAVYPKIIFVSLSLCFSYLINIIRLTSLKPSA